MNHNELQKELVNEEKRAATISGMGMFLLTCLLTLASIFGIFYSVASGAIAFLIISLIYLVIIMPFLWAGLKILKPNEAYVLTIFGKYYGTLKGPGFFFVNPFVTAAKPGVSYINTAMNYTHNAVSGEKNAHVVMTPSKKISLKAMTLSSDKQKINDLMGNPIEIGIVVIWRVVNTAKAIFNVDNYHEFLSIQCDSALRNIVRLYPYDIPDEDDESSLRGSSEKVAGKLKIAIQEKVEIAGLEVLEARITHLAYAPEIAAAMLQRQQAAAIIDARAAIVKGAVGMVEMALAQLSENGIVDLDEERKAAMVSNLLVVLCGSKDAQPIVNSGSIY
ncbi:MAG: SPFH domain-containing protein [Syntrophomonadaceae bacterium]|jgi:regulator of protease activity HflC (stomatin/prohibitin superfamily)|nr:SPFH domain-containing protein [Syntrophomonadaceae bacterium]